MRKRVTSDPAWRGWEAVLVEGPLEWRVNQRYSTLDCFVADRRVAWLQARPNYCDRGHWTVGCELPRIDGADSFPRYFMSYATAIAETEAFLRWRLWKKRTAFEAILHDIINVPEAMVAHMR